MCTIHKLVGDFQFAEENHGGVTQMVRGLVVIQVLAGSIPVRRPMWLEA